MILIFTSSNIQSCFWMSASTGMGHYRKSGKHWEPALFRRHVRQTSCRRNTRKRQQPRKPRNNLKRRLMCSEKWRRKAWRSKRQQLQHTTLNICWKKSSFATVSELWLSRQRLNVLQFSLEFQTGFTCIVGGLQAQKITVWETEIPWQP